MAERGRARAFLDTLHVAGEQIARALPPEYVEAEASLLADISEGQAALRGGGLTAASRRDLQTAIRTDEDQLAALKLRLMSDLPAIAAVRYPQLWTAEGLSQRLIRPDQAMVAFFLGAKASTCWIVTARGLRVVRLPAEAEIERAVRAYLAVVTQPGFNRANAGRGRSGFCCRASTGPGVRSLIVIPHGIPHDLPLDVLIDASGRRLIEQYEPHTRLHELCPVCRASDAAGRARRSWRLATRLFNRHSRAGVDAASSSSRC